jgi:hypothetical protein
MKKIIYALTTTILILLSLFFGFRFGRNFEKGKQNEINSYILDELGEFNSAVYTTEKNITEKVPVYSDYDKGEIRSKLRTYLYVYHIPIAKKFGVLINTDADIEKLAAEKKLVTIDKGIGYYFYGVPRNYRYLTPDAKKALELITDRFRDKTVKYLPNGVTVKLAVSSAVRPVEYQKKLYGTNSNAISESTHSYGVSFDIFFDDYYVSLPVEKNSHGFEIIEKLYVRYGYVLGDALRNQLHTLLAETILELQDEGKIYAIHENRQKVYHITFKK